MRASLANGTTVVVHPDPRLGFVVVHVAVDTGSRDDPPGRSGLAHIVEHVICDADTDAEPPRARTGLERTGYVLTGVPDELAELLDRGARRLARGADRLDEDALAGHRRIVTAEIGEREAPSRFGSGLRRSLRLRFGDSHPYGRPPVGAPAEVAVLGRDDVAAFIEERYAPARIVVAIVGPVEPERAVELAAAAFGRLPARTPRPIGPVGTAPAGRLREDVEEGHSCALLRYTFALPTADGRTGSAADAAAAGVALAALAGPSWSALGAGFGRRHGLLGTTAEYIGCGFGSSLALLKLSASAAAELSDLEAAVDGRLRRLAETGPPDDVLAAAKALRAKEILLARSAARTLAEELCDRVFKQTAASPDAADPPDEVALVRAVTAADVAEIAERCFQDPAVVVFHAADTRETSWIV